MPPIDQKMVIDLLNTGKNSHTTTGKGKALEDLICYVFGLIPGITITRRNTLNVFNTEEIDVALWNEKDQTGIPLCKILSLSNARTGLNRSVARK
jgi:hypothetical protein